MKTVIIFTVGGSHQPIVQSIRQNKADFVHFVCSEDSGTTKGSYTQVIGPGKVLRSDNKLDHPDLPNIVKVSGLGEGQYEVYRIKGFDNLEDCYLFAAQLIERVQSQHPEARIIADYTGGTKSMTAGLAAAALDHGRCELQLVTGLRTDLRQVADRTEFVRPVLVWDMQVKRRIGVAKDLMTRFDYAGAGSILEDAAARFASDTTVTTLQRMLAICRAFEAWDRFDHSTASRLIQPHRGQFVGHAKFLDAVLGGKHAHGFEWVEDLLLNAERRAVQSRFDDAVGRLYRALELTAQTWLKLRYGIQTGDVDIDRIPEGAKPKVEKARDETGRIKIALMGAWDLVSAFDGDPLANAFMDERGALLAFLDLRNQSLFAHGSTPVGERDYRERAPLVQNFVRCAMDKAVATLRKKPVPPLPQFPTHWE